MPPAGIILVVAFVVILVICLYVDKNAGKKFKKEIEEKYPVKDSFENIFVTEKGELLYYLPSGTLPGYKKWNLKDIVYVNTNSGKMSGGRVYYFSVAGADKKGMNGEYLTPSKKNFLKEKLYASFMVGGPDTVKQYVAFIQKHGPHIQYMVNGEEKEL